MRKCCFAAVCAVLMAAALGAQTGGEPWASYYVSAAGNDRNNGLSEAAAFKSLAHAVSRAARSDMVKTVTVIGTLNEASEGGSLKAVFGLSNAVGKTGNRKDPILITGLSNPSARRRAVLSAAGADRNCVRTFGAFRFERIEISGSGQSGLFVGMESEVTLGPGSLVRDNQGGGVHIAASFDWSDALPEDAAGPGSLILDGGTVENNCRQHSWKGGGIFVGGAFTLKRGIVRNNAAVSYGDVGSTGGGIYIESSEPVSIEGGDITGNTAIYGGGLCIYEGQVTMSGGSISGNTAEGYGGGVWVAKGASLIQQGGSISGNTAAGYGGGIWVAEGASFIQRGGTVSGNHAAKHPDIWSEN